jgi:hypothetical protein
VREGVYEAAKRVMPARSRGRAARNWNPVGEVWLNQDTPADDLPETVLLAT